MTAPVPFVDLKREAQFLAVPLADAFRRVMDSGRVLMGDEVTQFEIELAAWHGVKYAVGVASGTDAVEIALRACGISGKVSMTAFTAVPTVNAIEAAGCTPVLVDVDPNTRNWKLFDVPHNAALTVHLYGLPAHMPAYVKHAVVEDCAHAMGAITAGGAMVGTLGRAGAISFYPTKILGALGDGGAIVTNDPEVWINARRIRHYGFLDNGDVHNRGQNSRLSELQAAFLRAKLPYVHSWIERRRAIAARYTEEFKGKVQTPTEPPGAKAVYHVYVIETDERDLLHTQLADQGIGTMVHYQRPIHGYARYRCLAEQGSFGNAERCAKRVLSLPCYPQLTDREQDQVIAAVKENT